MTHNAITCPKCREVFTVHELIHRWGYDAGDFFDTGVLEPDDVAWENFINSIEFSLVEDDSVDYGYPIGQVGSA